MGYYSQVGYVIQGKKDEIVPILMTYRLAHKDSVHAKQALDECTYSINDEWFTIKFFTDNAKWYDGYPDVDNHTSLFNAFADVAETDGSTINGCFVRIGEDDADIVSRSYGPDPYDLVRAVRGIEFDVEATDSLEEVLK